VPERVVSVYQQGFAFVAVADQLEQHRGLQLTTSVVGDISDYLRAVRSSFWISTGTSQLAFAFCSSAPRLWPGIIGRLYSALQGLTPMEEA